MKKLTLFLAVNLMIGLFPLNPVYAVSTDSWAYEVIKHIQTKTDAPTPILKTSFKNYPLIVFTGEGWRIEQWFNQRTGPLTTAYYMDETKSLTWDGSISWTKYIITETNYTIEIETPPTSEPQTGFIVLKANFHTHTTVSDGQFTPEQVCEIYKDHGYDVLALTDHGAYRQYDYAKEYAAKIGLTLIPGSEIIVHKAENVSTSEILGLFISGPVTMSRTGDVNRIIEDIHNMNGLAYVCHPTKSPEFWVNQVNNSLIDGWETPFPKSININGTINLRNHDFHNERQIPILEEYYNLVIAYNNTAQGIYEALESGRVVIYDRGTLIGLPEYIQIVEGN